METLWLDLLLKSELPRRRVLLITVMACFFVNSPFFAEFNYPYTVYIYMYIDE